MRKHETRSKGNLESWVLHLERRGGCRTLTQSRFLITIRRDFHCSDHELSLGRHEKSLAYLVCRFVCVVFLWRMTCCHLQIIISLHASFWLHFINRAPFEECQSFSCTESHLVAVLKPTCADLNLIEISFICFFFRSYLRQLFECDSSKVGGARSVSSIGGWRWIGHPNADLVAAAEQLIVALQTQVVPESRRPENRNWLIASFVRFFIINTKYAERQLKKF